MLGNLNREEREKQEGTLTHHDSRFPVRAATQDACFGTASQG